MSSQPNQQFARVISPNAAECDYVITDVEGEIPRELNGSLFRNGPNQHVQPAAGSEAMSFFEGDGMIRRVALEDGKARFTSKYVPTESFLFESAQGAYCMGGSNLAADTINDSAPRRTLNNTNAVVHANKLLAMAENSAPFVLDPNTLEPRGEWDFGGKASGPWTSAHPKLDPRTGQMVLHGYYTEAPYLQLYIIDADGTVSLSETMDAPWPTLFHDLAISEHHAIVPLGSAVYKPERAINSTRQVWDCLEIDVSLNMRFGVRGREQGAQTRWLEAPTPGNIFHVGNAYERDGHIVLDACTYKNPAILGEAVRMRTSGGADAFNPYLFIYEINLESGQISETQLNDFPIEFPRIDDRFVAYANRYVFATTGPGGESADASLRRVSRYDFQTNTFQHAPMIDGRWVGEPVFVPRAADADEGDGFLLAFIFDAEREAAGLEIRDARHLESSALATLWFDERMPFDFHGNWVQRAA